MIKSTGHTRPWHAAEGGSVLLLTLALTMSLMTIVSTFYYSSRTQLQVDFESGDSLRAELMASSALEYALVQIRKDPDWEGMDGDWVGLGSSRFSVDRLNEGNPSQIHLRLSGVSGEATTVHEAFVSSEETGRFGDNALVVMGGDLDINQVDIEGDILFVDSPEGILEFDSGTGEWKKPDVNFTPDVRVKNTDLEGDIFTYTGTDYLESLVKNPAKFAKQARKTEVIEYGEPTKVPYWDLDGLLSPGPDHIVVNSDKLMNVVTNLTVVIVANPGDQIIVNQCDLDGGLVIYAESGRDYRTAARNELIINQSSFGGGMDGVAADLGIIAPGAHLKVGNHIQDSRGMFFFHSVKNLHNSAFEGSLASVNGLTQMHGVDLKHKPLDLTLTGGVGALLGGGSLENLVRVNRIWESFEAQEDPTDKG